MLVLLISLVLCHTVQSEPTKVEYDVDDLVKVQQLFKDFIVKYDRHYAPGEESQRFLNFREDLRTINRMNKENPYAYFDINHFSDLSNEEWTASLGLYSNWNVTDDPCQTKNDPTTHDATPTLDWRDKHVVTPVKNQLACGSCWAFSATGNVEGQYALKHGQKISVSEQQLVDCDKQSHGCDGGWPHWAFGYILQSGGLKLENDYQYTGYQSVCQFDNTNVAVTLTGCNIYKLSGEADLKEVLFQTGPLSIVVDATSLKGYHNGILTKCDFNEQNHAILLVGYGSENGQDFWIIKNSWSAQFGEAGYARVQRGVGCIGIGSYVTSSIVA